LTTPWGFRLEGGRDFHYPLTIQRVFAGSPAVVDLQRGDIIVSINSRDATHMLHNDANDLIRTSGGSINLGIKRGLNFTSSNPNVGGASGMGPVANFKLNPYNLLPQPKPAFILKQQSSKPDIFMSAITNGPVWHQPNQLYMDDGFQQEMYVRSQSTHKQRDPKPILSQTGSPCVPLGLTQIGNRSSVKRYRPASTMPIIQRGNYSEPGVFTHDYPGAQSSLMSHHPLPFYDKKMVGQIQQSLSKAVHSPVGYPINAPGAFPTITYQNDINTPTNNNNNNVSYYSINPSRPTSSLNTNVPPLPTSTPTKVYSHHEVSSAPVVANQQRKPDGPKVLMQQYNSPVGLYSREAFTEEYYKQVGNNNEAVNEASTE